VLIFFFLFLPLISRQFHSYYSGLDSIQGNYWFYTSNWNMIRNGLPEQPIFFHFWSLAVEEQFYFIWPVLFLICGNPKSKYILISGLLSLSAMSRITTEVPLHAYLSSLTAAEPLLIGCLLCILQEDGMLGRVSRKLNILSILSVIFLCIVFIRDQDLHITNIWLIKYGYSAINIILAAIITSAIVGRPVGARVRKMFSIKWLKWLGVYSYSIYVFHWIILKTVVYKAESALVNSHWPELLAYLLPRIMGIVVTLIVSYFSYHYFEKHFLSLKKYFTGDKRWNWNISWNYIFRRQTKPARH
jgi:peptidoglycan/LPS O-acetylase OafA/YrhL